MRVLLATDGTGAALEARRLITAVFEPTAVEVTVLSVAEQEMFVPDGITFPSVASEILGQARQVAEREALALSTAGFPARAATNVGSAPREIARFANEQAQSVIVLGERSRHLHGVLPLGSVSLSVLHRTRSSVLIVHRSPGESRGWPSPSTSTVRSKMRSTPSTR